MGCCCCRNNDEDGIQLYDRSSRTSSNSKYKGMGSDSLQNDEQNDSVMCKCGPHADGIVITKELDTNTWKVEAVSGGGIALGTCPLDCDTAIWQVRLGNNPSGIRIGTKRYNPKSPSDLNGLMNSTESEKESPSWSMGATENDQLKTGDVVDVYWDQTDLPMLSFSVNEDAFPAADVTRVRPANDVRPAVSLEKGSSCEIIFDGRNFTHKPKSSKFKNIICSTSLI